MRIETTTSHSGLRTIRAVNHIGTIAMAVEHPRGEGTIWNLAIVQEPAGMSAEQPSPYPEVHSAEVAQAWVAYLGELMECARAAVARPVWCPNDTRETARAATEHVTERGVEVIE